MENQNQQPNTTGQTTIPQPVVPLAQTVTATNQQDKPKLNISSNQAQALLTVNNLLTAQQSKTKPPVKLLITVIGLIAFAILTSYLMGAFKPGEGSKSSNSSSGIGLPNQSDPTSGSDVSKQINQDEKSCSSPVNAVTVC